MKIKYILLGSVNSHLGVSWVALEEKVWLRDTAMVFGRVLKCVRATELKKTRP